MPVKHWSLHLQLIGCMGVVRRHGSERKRKASKGFLGEIEGSKGVRELSREHRSSLEAWKTRGKKRSQKEREKSKEDSI